jgi:phosphatidylglycerol---prolipoprotein diacylglyceryl transferase
MTALGFLIWNGNPEIFTISIPFINSEITLRWYGLLFALGFLISQQILYYIYKKEGKPESDVDQLTLYMVIATIVGARLGHVLFYEPDLYLHDPIKILKVWEGGLASHGAAAAILFALWLYARKKKPGQSYLQVVDRIVILVALTGALIRLGNFFNSEIIGRPTHSNYGVVFARSVTEALERSGQVEDVAYVKVDSSRNENGYPPVKMLVDFLPATGSDKNQMNMAISRISAYQNPRDHIDVTSSFIPNLVPNENNAYSAIVFMYMIPRHPAQLYESASCLLLFILLLWMWSKQKGKTPPGRLLGTFLIVCFGLRFIFEFIKEPQVAFETDMVLNMGQILSIPLVLAGIGILTWSIRKKSTHDSALP